MKIESARLWSYCLPLSRPLPTAAKDARYRAGLLLEFRSQDGVTGFGEIAPLPGYSSETLSESQTEVEAALWHLKGSSIPPNLEELSGGFENWLGKIACLPSARFGLESAILNLLAADQKMTSAELVADHPGDHVHVNGLLSGSPDEVVARAEELIEKGYRALKLKVGRLGMDEEIELVQKVRRAIGEGVALRLDANGRFTIDEATRFAYEIADCHIEYIEEPVPGLSALRSLLKHGLYPLPLALDESLVSLQPSDLANWDQIQTIVIKPTRLGLERAMMFARFATARKIKVVVSSTFESGVGILMLINFAAALNREDVPVGLDTLGWFESDVLAKPLAIGSNPIRLEDLPRTIDLDSLNPDLISEVNRA